MDPWQLAVRYHEETKHHYHRFARSLGYLDWHNQPDPFRRFVGAPSLSLPLVKSADGPMYDDVYVPGTTAPQPVTVETISAFLQRSLGLSAWKQYKGSKWALRINPSSGNLHPTEGYLIAGAVSGLTDRPAVFHYAPKDHLLERRATFDTDTWSSLCGGLPPETFLIGLASIHWREAWKYGERAYRYCQHDAGHALAAIAYSAAVLGWQLRVLDGAADEQAVSLMGLDRLDDFSKAEREHPELLAAVIPSLHDRPDGPCGLDVKAVDQIRGGLWIGRANALSEDHFDWPIIEMVAEACAKPGTWKPVTAAHQDRFGSPLVPDQPAVPAAQIIYQRRSAVAMDGRTSLPAERFYVMLDRCLPRYDRVPFGAVGPPVCVHLGLFVHLIGGIPPGLYFLVRSSGESERLREAMHAPFEWARPKGCPADLPLYRLRAGDYRSLAQRVSCDQPIAGAGAFSLSMIAAFEPTLRQHGAWFYRRLHSEAGMIGQVLYLEAEAAGLRGTGIGCYFDDAVHEVFGLHGRQYQSLYHFTVGGPVEDPRLTTLPPYDETARPKDPPEAR